MKKSICPYLVIKVCYENLTSKGISSCKTTDVHIFVLVISVETDSKAEKRLNVCILQRKNCVAHRRPIKIKDITVSKLLTL